MGIVHLFVGIVPAFSWAFCVLRGHCALLCVVREHCEFCRGQCAFFAGIMFFFVRVLRFRVALGSRI